MEANISVQDERLARPDRDLDDATSEIYYAQLRGGNDLHSDGRAACGD